MASLILFNKPYRVLSQFTDSDGRRTLADFIDAPGHYAAGRLDYDSEGLLLLTDSGALQHRISAAGGKAWKRYWLQVEGEISEQAVTRLREGVVLKDGPTLPARVKPIADPALWPRDPPVRTRRQHPTSWLEISVREGRNRQLRRMSAAVGFPTLRLVRVAIGDWSLDKLMPGKFRTTQVHLPRVGTRRGGQQR